ncbi:hypothetical protein L9F63_018512, partial [Diploptera punctata]
PAALAELCLLCRIRGVGLIPSCPLLETSICNKVPYTKPVQEVRSTMNYMHMAPQNGRTRATKLYVSLWFYQQLGLNWNYNYE